MAAKTEKPVKRRKPKRLRKEDSIRIRVTEDQKRLLTEAARADGTDLGPWLLGLGMRQARIIAAERTAVGGLQSNNAG
jgi:uncharacterized protein (DUF1778 family)